MIINYISNIVEEFSRWFRIFNLKYFDNQLNEPIFTVQKARPNTLGHCTVSKIWQNPDNTDTNYEINISAHVLLMDTIKIAGVVLHEMIHLYHLANEIKDCNGRIHNKKFKAKAEELGFIVEKHRSIGWGITEVGYELKEFIDNKVNPDSSIFKYARFDLTIQKEKKKTMFDFICPDCGGKAKAKEDMTLVCGNCGVEMEIQ